MSIVKRLNTLVRIMNKNEDDNEEKLYSILTNLIRKITFFYNNRWKIIFKYSLE